MSAINHPLRRGRGQLPFPMLPRPNWWVLGSAVIAGMGAMLPVFQNSATTSTGFELQSLQAEQSRLQGEIGLLESDVARLSSLSRIQRRADELGLVVAYEPIYVRVEEAGPQPAKIPAELLPPPGPRAVGGSSWWRSLFEWLPLPH
jgi:hypothetical protein